MEKHSVFVGSANAKADAEMNSLIAQAEEAEARAKAAEAKCEAAKAAFEAAKAAFEAEKKADVEREKTQIAANQILISLGQRHATEVGAIRNISYEKYREHANESYERMYAILKDIKPNDDEEMNEKILTRMCTEFCELKGFAKKSFGEFILKHHGWYDKIDATIQSENEYKKKLEKYTRSFEECLPEYQILSEIMLNSTEDILMKKMYANVPEGICKLISLESIIRDLLAASEK